MHSDGRKIRSLEVAERAQISRSTVSRVLSGDPRISEATRARVLAAADEADGLPAQAAAAMLERTVSAMIAFLVADEESRPVALFMMRELAAPGPVLDRIYSGLIEPVHGAACRVWAAATGAKADAPDTKLAVFSLLGQVLYFRIARSVVMRRLDWPVIAASEHAAIDRTLATNLRASIDAARAANGLGPLNTGSFGEVSS